MSSLIMLIQIGKKYWITIRKLPSQVRSYRLEKKDRFVIRKETSVISL
jgi:hypothetical protein